MKMKPFTLVLMLGLTFFMQGAARAYTVTSLGEGITANDGTLRGALIAANAGPGGETIDFNIPAGGTIILTGGEMVLTKSVTITGPAAANITINGSSNRIFNIQSGITVAVSRLKLMSATAPSSSANGGAILNAGSLTLTECWFKDCFAVAGSSSFGPGVNGGNAGHGGAVASSGPLTITGCTFDNCRGGRGGNGGPSQQATSTRGGNGGNGGSGGGVWANAGSATLTNCTFYQCTAGNGGDGGSGYSSGSFGSGGSGGNGGGVSNGGSAAIQITSCTFDGGNPGSGGTGLSFPGPYGQGADVYGPASVRNSLMVTNNSASTAFANSVSSVAYNLFGQGESSMRVASLAANGGPVPTCALLPGSVALDAGDPTLTGTDQRGSPRLSGASPDVGAFEYTFTGGAVPDVVVGSPSGITNTAATINATVNANGIATTVTVEYGSTTSYGSIALPAFSPNNGTSPAAISASLSGFLPVNTYHYRITATNAGGIVRSSDATFTTLPTPPSVTTNAATGISSTGATLNGFVGSSVVPTIVFEYGLTTSYGSTVSYTPSGGSPWNPASAVSGLSPVTTYHYRLSATNGGGTTYGADKTFTTLASNNADLSALTLTSITLSPTFAAATTSYTASVANAVGSTTVTPTTASTGATVKVNGVSQTSGTASPSIALAVGSNTITIAVTAQDGTTIKTYSVTVTRDVPPAAPTVTTGIASAITSSSVILNGTVNANGSNSTPTFDYGLTTSYGSVASGSPNPVTGSTTQNVSASFSGLQAGVTYHYRLRATNAGGTTNGADGTFTTTQPLPSATIYAASAITATSVRLSGTGDPNTSAATAIFEYGLTTSYGGSTAVENFAAGSYSHSFSRDVTGLTPGTLYHARIAITNAVGTVYSSDITFTTGMNTGTNADLSGMAATFGTPTGSVITFPPSPAFSSNVTSYNIPVDQSAIDFNVTAADPAAVVLLGYSSSPGAATLSPGTYLSVPVGGNFNSSTQYVTVEVRSAGGVSVKTYTFVIYRPSAPTVGSASVSNVTSSSATLSGTYSPGVGSPGYFQFIVWDPAGVAPIPSTETRADGESTTFNMTSLAANILYNYRFGAYNSTGAASVVTSFTTPGIPGSALLSVLGGGPFTPEFSSNVFNYTRTVSNGTTSIALVPVLQDSAAVLSVNGQATVSGSTRTLNLAVGPNTITLHCIATGGGTQDYTLTVLRQAAAVTQSSWRQTHFGSTVNSGDGADLADPDGDGIPNLLEWACAMNPNASNATAPGLQRNGASMTYTYTRSSGAVAAGAIFAVECSTSLGSSDWHTTGITQTVIADDGTTQTVQAVVPANSTACFARVKVTAP